MGKRIGVIAILLTDKKNVNQLNSILSDFGEIIIGRLGLPLKEKSVHVISVIVEGTTDQISAMTGKIGNLSGIQVKSVLTKFKETDDAYDSYSPPKKF
ncbi:MAG: iron-only hydrogenase system regulator [Spirochaetes bacterium]|nr:iron-only hydrogenase system regulator [Spirochaetota bacterium]